MELTDRQSEVAEFIRQWWTEHGYGPSLADLAGGLAISKPTALETVRRLKRLGVVKYTPKTARSTRLAQNLPKVSLSDSADSEQ
jgi:SOS-response transcriptional repressor LexA